MRASTRAIPQQPGLPLQPPGPLRRRRTARQAVLTIREKTFGPDHPDVAESPHGQVSHGFDTLLVARGHAADGCSRCVGEGRSRLEGVTRACYVVAHEQMSPFLTGWWPLFFICRRAPFC